MSSPKAGSRGDIHAKFELDILSPDLKYKNSVLFEAQQQATRQEREEEKEEKGDGSSVEKPPEDEDQVMMCTCDDRVINECLQFTCSPHHNLRKF